MLTDYKVYSLTKKEKRDFVIVASVGIFTMAYLFYHSIILSAAALLSLPFLRPMYEKYMAKKRQHLLKEQFRDLLYSLSASFAAGRQMPEALAEAPENLGYIYDKDAPIMLELTQMVRGIFEGHEREDLLLLDFGRRSGIEDIKSFAEVYVTSRSTGADMCSVITRTADSLAEKMNIEREIEAITAQKRLEGKLISLMPCIVILALNLISPDYLEALYSGFGGRLIMTACLAAIGYAYYLIMKLTDIAV